ncbi:MAG: stage II sporulation protein R [Oscillibacter sp.]|nr:stage II sporulation protein R [Oscillibacter sp.]
MSRFRMPPLGWVPLLLLILALLGGFSALRSQRALAAKVIRLHVLAASDSAEDQARKLRVRDAVLEEANGVLRSCENRAEAEARLRSALPRLCETAEGVLLAENCADRVTATLETESFSTRRYGDFALPAGDYLSLRVSIGEGKGRNWWCVVFPPLCSATTVSDISAAALSAGLSEADVALITEQEGYVLKFKTLEWLAALREKLR